jgi:hypothetical protein
MTKSKSLLDVKVDVRGLLGGGNSHSTASKSSIEQPVACGKSDF